MMLQIRFDHFLKLGIDILLPRQSDIQCYKLYDVNRDIPFSN